MEKRGDAVKNRYNRYAATERESEPKQKHSRILYYMRRRGSRVIFEFKLFCATIFGSVALILKKKKFEMENTNEAMIVSHDFCAQ